MYNHLCVPRKEADLTHGQPLCFSCISLYCIWLLTSHERGRVRMLERDNQVVNRQCSNVKWQHDGIFRLYNSTFNISLQRNQQPMNDQYQHWWLQQHNLSHHSNTEFCLCYVILSYVMLIMFRIMFFLENLSCLWCFMPGFINSG